MEFRFLVMRLEERGTREIRAALGVSGEKMKQLRERLREAAGRVGLRRTCKDRGSS